MNIITENGKDYLETYIAKLDNTHIDAAELFLDLYTAVKTILKNKNAKNMTRDTIIQKNEYGYNLQAIINRFSGTYTSPSMMKNYLTNPALSLASCTFAEADVNAATSIGTTIHKILEEYYKLPANERSRDKLWVLEEQLIEDGQNKDKLDEYISGYITSGDYLGGDLDDTTLKCDTEHYGRTRIYIKELDYVLPLDTSYVVDRIDYRDDGIYIIDYKTGRPGPAAATFDGYLGSMLLYKWAIEQELGIKVKGAYLMCPGKKRKPYMELDMSLANQRSFIDTIEKFYKQFTRDAATRIYEYTDRGYFTTDEARAFKATMNDDNIQMAKIPVRVYVGEHDANILNTN